MFDTNNYISNMNNFRTHQHGDKVKSSFGFYNYLDKQLKKFEDKIMRKVPQMACDLFLNNGRFSNSPDKLMKNENKYGR